MKNISVVKDLIEIKNSIEAGGSVKFHENDLLMERIGELDKKIDSMKDLFQKKPVIRQDIPKYKATETPVKSKRKEEVMKILKENKRLTATQLSTLTGMSRTRCNEYLKELEKDGMAQGTVINKKKFYRLVKWVV